MTEAQLVAKGYTEKVEYEVASQIREGSWYREGFYTSKDMVAQHVRDLNRNRRVRNVVTVSLA